MLAIVNLSCCCRHRRASGSFAASHRPSEAESNFKSGVRYAQLIDEDVFSL